VRDPAVFRRAARRAAAAGKAIVVLKAGSSALSARTAAAHTGALVGDDRVIDAVFADLGVIRVDSIEDMLITAGAAAALGRLPRPGIGIVSISGGACDIVADRAEDLGAELPELAAETRAALAAVMPGYGTVQNPLDVTGAAIIDPSLFTKAIEAISRDPSVGVVGVINSLPWLDDGRPYFGQVFVDAIGAGMRSAACPSAYINQVMQPITGHTRACMERGGVPYAIPGLRQAVVALRNVAWWSAASRPAAGEPGSLADPAVTVGQVEPAVAAGAPGSVVAPRPSDPAVAAAAAVRERRGQWSEEVARRLLEAAGIPVVPARLAASAEEAVKAAAAYGGPVCLKVVSPQVTHKTDIGGVRLDVPLDESAVTAAYTAVTAAAAAVDGAVVEGVLVSPMRRGGTELLVGVVADPQWGPVLAVALGGVFVEVVQDSVLTPLPVTASRARELLGRLRGRAVLDGARGGAPADLDALAAVIARVGDLAVALGDDLAALEVNPLRADGAVIEALDALVTWKD
jgi:acyl-CoA synthetase (NDP forming)